MIHWALLALAAALPLLAQSPDLQPGERDVSLNIKKFAGNFFSDQKKIWTFPLKLAQGKHWKPTLAVAGVTAGLVAADAPIARYVKRHEGQYDGFNRVFSENHSTGAVLLTPAAFYVAGLIGRDSYLKRTGLLAAEAWVSVDITAIAFRSAMRRTRPTAVPPGASFSDTWFQTGANPMKSAGSFPSGHTGWSFAVASVVARRHGKKHKWVPFLAYGLASIGAISRLTTQQHYLSDDFFGAALGYSIGRFVVLRQ